MNQDTEKARERIIGWIQMMADLPRETTEGVRQDEIFRQRLLTDLAKLDVSLNALTGLCQVRNSLSGMIGSDRK